MALIDPEFPKDYKNGRVLYEQNLDAWRQATEDSIATINLNLTQMSKDCHDNSYSYDNDGAANLAVSLQAQINNLTSGATPISGTSSDTFTINTDGNSAVLSTLSLTAIRTFLLPDISGTFVMTEGNQTINGTKTFSSNISLRSGTAFDGIFDHAITAGRTWTLPDNTGHIPVLPNPATGETGSGNLVRTTTPTITSATLVTPVIADFTTAQHNHSNAAGGGNIPETSITDGAILARVGGNEAITGAWTFNSTLPTSSVAPSGSSDLVTKTYVDALQGLIKGWARVKSDGTLLAGFNATSARNSAGKYTITWGTDFSSVNYAAVASCNDAANASRATTFSPTAGTIRVQTVDSTGADSDLDFSIIAIGTQ